MIVAANRTRHPLDARTLARLAAQYAGRGVVGFGLSNDERRGRPEDFAPAFRIADAGRAARGAARRRAGRAGQRRRLPGRARRRPDRPRRPVGRGPGAAGPAGRPPASPWRSARPPTSRSASTPTAADVPLRTLRDGRRPGRARAPTTRCCSARGWPRSTSWPASAHGFDRRGAGRAGPLLGARLGRAPTTCGAGCSPGIDGWLASRPPSALSSVESPTSTGSGTEGRRRTGRARRRGSRGPAPAGPRWWRRRGWSGPGCAWWTPGPAPEP